LTVFSLIAIGVACFVIYNVFSITAAQRQRENALMRAVGAQRRQVSRAMLIEAVVVGVIGSLLGLIAGVFVSSALKQFLGVLGVEFPSTSLRCSRTIVLTPRGHRHCAVGHPPLRTGAFATGACVIGGRARGRSQTNPHRADRGCGGCRRHPLPRWRPGRARPCSASGVRWCGSVLILGPVLAVVAAR
jgi:hypothetical protein